LLGHLLTEIAHLLNSNLETNIFPSELTELNQFRTHYRSIHFSVVEPTDRKQPTELQQGTDIQLNWRRYSCWVAARDDYQSDTQKSLACPSYVGTL